MSDERKKKKDEEDATDYIVKLVQQATKMALTQAMREVFAELDKISGEYNITMKF